MKMHEMVTHFRSSSLLLQEINFYKIIDYLLEAKEEIKVIPWAALATYNKSIYKINEQIKWKLKVLKGLYFQYVSIHKDGHLW